MSLVYLTKKIIVQVITPAIGWKSPNLTTPLFHIHINKCPAKSIRFFAVVALKTLYSNVEFVVSNYKYIPDL